MILHGPKDEAAATHFTRVVRGYLGRIKVRAKAHVKYARFFDVKLNKFYWMNKETNFTFWNASAWLIAQNIDMSQEDILLFNQYMKIKQLEDALKAKDEEIKEVRLKTYQELEPEVILDRVATAKNLERSKYMDEWSTDDLAAWFVELKMDEYIPFLYQNRVDGLLFINLADTDWADMGIINRFHVRKLQLILKAFRFRHQKKSQREEVDEDDELISEYSPSELSDVIAQEDDDVGDDLEDDGPTLAESTTVGGFAEDEDDTEMELIKETDEQRQEKAIDMLNIQLNVKVHGDGENYPMAGDIVRVRYVCSLYGQKKIISSTKATLQRASVEFVLGINHLIKGIDRALPLMSVGERTVVTVTPEYGYGKEGLFPLIPSDSILVYDITLLGFRPRPKWVNPLIQQPNFTQKPFEQETEELFGVAEEDI
jgi:FK506-binding protein 1